MPSPQQPAVCHPERSTAASEASRRAQSKDPYSSDIIPSASRRSPSVWVLLYAVERTPRSAPDAEQLQGILRLRELMRARFAQDDNALSIGDREPGTEN